MELRKYQKTPSTFHETLDLRAALIKRDNSTLDVAPVEVEGLVSADKKGYTVHYTVQTILIAPSTHSLEPVELPMDLSVDEVFMTEEQFQSRDEQMPAGEILLTKGSLLNLAESTEDNILLATPMRVLMKKEEAATKLPRGNDWEVVSEEEYQRRKMEETEDKTGPRLARPSELFDSEPKSNDNK